MSDFNVCEQAISQAVWSLNFGLIGYILGRLRSQALYRRGRWR